MKSWTGLYGEEDERARSNGDTYIVASNLDVKKVIGKEEDVEDVEKEIEEEIPDWGEWYAIVAPDEETAKERFEDAANQFRAYNEGKFTYPPHEVEGKPKYHQLLEKGLV